jgi:medium-chain acyl-[acyl-carrier-protein] hydrolase
MSPWLFLPKQTPYAKLKLICFPYAGGSARSFSEWQAMLPNDVEQIIIQMPGRGSRFSEPTIDCMDTLTDTIIKELTPHLDCPFIFYGHSLGARVAFEIQRKMALLSMQQPEHFIASGSAFPGKDRSDDITHSLDDDAFKAKLASLNGTPPAVLEHEELMMLFMPVLRADFKLADTYQYEGNQQFSADLSVFIGETDEITKEEQHAWKNYFTGAYDSQVFNGDHFFIDSHNQQVGHAVRAICEEVLAKSVVNELS